MKGFTYDSKDRFKGLPGFLESEVHGSGRKFVPIIECAIANQSSTPYRPLSQGLKDQVFMIDHRTGKPFVGRVWPGSTYWVDYTNPKSSSYWSDMFKDFHQVLPFDGAWLDMNDPSNFDSGAVEPKGCANNSLNDPPFNPAAYEPLYLSTVCPDAQQYMGSHYEWHNVRQLPTALSKKIETLFIAEVTRCSIG